MELTSLGRAWLAAASDDERQQLLNRFRERRSPGWRDLSRDIAAAIDSVRTQGYCWAAWQSQVVALATPITLPDHQVYVLNMSVAGDTPPQGVVKRLREPLLNLAQSTRQAVHHL